MHTNWTNPAVDSIEFDYLPAPGGCQELAKIRLRWHGCRGYRRLHVVLEPVVGAPAEEEDAYWQRNTALVIRDQPLRKLLLCVRTVSKPGGSKENLRAGAESPWVPESRPGDGHQWRPVLQLCQA